MAASKANPESKEFVKKLISTVFTDIAMLGDKVTDENIEMLCEGGMSKEDRSIPIETANYLLKNFGVILLGLISNDVFRDSFKDAVAVEISLDEKTEEFVNDIRKDMGEEPGSFDPENRFVVDLSVFRPNVAEKIGNMVGDALNVVTDFEDEFNNLVKELSEDNSLTIGFIVSNCAYLIRAFSHNSIFVDYIKDVVKIVRDQLDI